MESLYKFGISILSFCIILLVSKLISKSAKFKFIEERTGRFSTLDGLRGFCAISVFYTHYIVTWYWINGGPWELPPEIYYHNYGKVGVAIFFMLTGFLFIGKLLKSREKINWLNLYESRLFRITPLYFLSVFFISILVFSSTNFEIHVKESVLFKEYLKWFLYHGESINNFADTKIINAGVDWTLKYEWLFYVSLPVIYLLLFKSHMVLKLSLLVIPIVLYFWPVNLLYFTSQYIILFMVGGLTSIIYTYYKAPQSIIQSKYISALTLVLALIAVIYPRTYSFEHIVIMSVFFALVALGNDMFGTFTTIASRVLGEISYSIYLLHGIFLYVFFTFMNVVELSEVSLNTYMIFMPLAGSIVVILCSVTFLYIEKPSISLGRKYFISLFITRLLNLDNEKTKSTRNPIAKVRTKHYQ